MDVWRHAKSIVMILSRPFLVPFLVPAFLLSQVPGGFYTLFYTHLLCHKNGRRMPHDGIVCVCCALCNVCVPTNNMSWVASYIQQLFST